MCVCVRRYMGLRVKSEQITEPLVHRWAVILIQTEGTLLHLFTETLSFYHSVHSVVQPSAMCLSVKLPELIGVQ